MLLPSVSPLCLSHSHGTPRALPAALLPLQLLRTRSTVRSRLLHGGLSLAGQGALEMTECVTEVGVINFIVSGISGAGVQMSLMMEIGDVEYQVHLSPIALGS